jgi:hypothetical protein
MLKRRGSRQALTLQDRLSAWANELREQAAKLPPGTARDTILRKASQADIASHLNDWANSPGLQPPE